MILRCINVIFFVCLSSMMAQYPQYPKNYFLFPIKPGQKNFLAGSMGELRPNHFHGGLDIRTDQKTGLPVYACADGYVSRIAISIKGYGNTLYIKHPNGLTTVYAHLEWFNGKIEKYVRDLVYKQQCNEIDINLMPTELSVKKGDTVAFSGNSGSSGGPHLHWEIRDEDEKLMNPLFFDFPEITDKIKPYVNKFALRTLSPDARVEGEFGLIEFTPIKTGDGYECKYPLHAFGTIGLQVVTYDQLEGSSSRCGISKMELRVDGKLTFTHDIQKIDFDENPLMNLHLDYATNKSKGNYYQKCYVSDGNLLNTYKTDFSKGKITIRDSSVHSISLKIFDSYRNFTVLYFKIKGTPNQNPHRRVMLSNWQKKQKAKHKVYQYLQTEEHENVLKINASLKDSGAAYIYKKGEKKPLVLAYQNENIYTYLHDLRKFLPDSITVGQFKKIFNFHSTVYPQTDNVINLNVAEVKIPQKILHDTLFLQTDFSNNILSIHDESHPTLGYYEIILKTTGVANKDRTSVFQKTGKGMKHSGGVWTGNQIKFKTKYYGDFLLHTDTIAPKLAFHKKVNQTLYFKTSDNISGISQWYAYLNGQFLFLHFDPKFNVIFTDLPPNLIEIKGNLIVGVVDGVGNKTEKTFTF